MSGTWLVCKSKLPHDPRGDTCLMVVIVGESQSECNGFNDWLRANNLYAYKDSYRNCFEKRQKLPEAVKFTKSLEVPR